MPPCWLRFSGFLYAHLQAGGESDAHSVLNHGIEFLFMGPWSVACSHVWGAVLGRDYPHRSSRIICQTLLPKLLGSNGNFEIIVFGDLDGVTASVRPGKGVCGPFVARLFPQWAAPPVPRSTLEALPQRPKPSVGEPLLGRRIRRRKQFGGLVAVNDVSFQVKGGRDHRA